MTSEIDKSGSTSASRTPAEANCDAATLQRGHEAELWYRTTHNGGLVFATPEEATWTDQIHKAFGAKTWGEFRRLMPEDAYGDLQEKLYWHVEELTLVPGDGDPFDAYSVPGVDEGDYPPWLQATMDRCLPEEIVEAFGVWRSSVLNGGYLSIPIDRETEVVEALQRLGYLVRRRGDLAFS